jgi:hypothetical protein
MSITKNDTSSHSTLEEKITAPYHEAKAKLEQVEADAKRKNIEIAALTGLALTKRNIDQKLEDYKKAHEANRSHAKAEIVAAIAAFTAAVHELGKKAKAPSEKK